MRISIQHRLTISEVLALYGHFLDDDQRHDFLPLYAELDELEMNWADNEHDNSPQHHKVKVHLDGDSDRAVRVKSKAVGVGTKSRPGGTKYGGRHVQ
jgi:hypothetical protein